MIKTQLKIYPCTRRTPTFEVVFREQKIGPFPGSYGWLCVVGVLRGLQCVRHPCARICVRRWAARWIQTPDVRRAHAVLPCSAQPRVRAASWMIQSQVRERLCDEMHPHLLHCTPRLWLFPTPCDMTTPLLEYPLPPSPQFTSISPEKHTGALTPHLHGGTKQRSFRFIWIRHCPSEEKVVVLFGRCISFLNVKV